MEPETLHMSETIVGGLGNPLIVLCKWRPKTTSHTSWWFKNNAQKAKDTAFLGNGGVEERCVSDDEDNFLMERIVSSKDPLVLYLGVLTRVLSLI